ncbi:hypothetical protein XPA_002042 [Xanthoria parietina]
MPPHAQHHPNKTPPCVRKDSYLAQGIDQFRSQGTEPSPSSPPMTLPKATPNIGKKRRALDLSRCTPGSSHSDKISSIFEDAGKTLCITPTPRPLQVNARRLRMPFSTTGSPKMLLAEAKLAEDSIRNNVSPGKENLLPLRGGVLSSPTPPQLGTCVQSSSQSRGPTYQPSNNVSAKEGCPVNEYLGREPRSDGFHRLTRNGTTDESTSLGEVVYPDLTRSQHMSEYPQLHEPMEQSGSGGPMVGIESWLKQIPDKNSPESIDRPGKAHFPRGRSEFSLRDCVPSRRDLSYNPSSLSKGSTFQTFTRVPQPFNSCRYLSSPPKRKAPRLSPAKDGSPAGPSKDRFEIYEEEYSDESVQLSPTVEKYRKGRRPRRERCVSYWDDDVIPSLAGKTAATKETDSDRQPLHELPELTRAKGFVDGVENADFDFNIQLNAPDTQHRLHYKDKVGPDAQ